MKSRDLSAYGMDLKSLRQERDPLGLRENIVRADLVDELHGLCVPYRRKRTHANKRGR